MTNATTTRIELTCYADESGALCTSHTNEELRQATSVERRASATCGQAEGHIRAMVTIATIARRAPRAARLLRDEAVQAGDSELVATLGRLLEDA